jgi:tRNA(fMet)-specific endonuclease VapC
MKRFLLDSGIVSDLVNHRNATPERARAETARGNRLGIGMPVLAELVSM